MSYLADVIIPEKEVDEIEVREVEQEEYVSDEEEQGVEEEPELLPPPPEKKVKLKKEDVFRPKAAPPKKVKVAPEPVVENEEPIIPKIAPVKKKRQLSEKQKEALRKGREARMKKKKQAEALATPAPAPAVYEAPKSEVEYKEKKMNEDYQRQQYFTQEQVADMIYSGVQKYDTERKARKAKKRQAQAKQQHEHKVFNDINSQLRVNDPWASAFNFN